MVQYLSQYSVNHVPTGFQYFTLCNFLPIFSLIITQMAITISWAYDYRPYNNNDDHKLRTDSNDKLSDNDQTKIKKKKKKKKEKEKEKEK